MAGAAARHEQGRPLRPGKPHVRILKPVMTDDKAVIWILKSQLGLERHGGRIPAGLWARIIQRLLALNACIWHNWQIGAP
jgi:hypothetical protein